MVMAIYWMTAVIPMGITGLLPVIMFPMFGLVSVPDVATNYIKVSSCESLDQYLDVASFRMCNWF
jgi:hypothetical protein